MQGCGSTDSPRHDPPPALALDQAIHAQQSRLTQGLSPASMINAWTDWALHLANSPGKQMELGVKAARKLMRLTGHVAQQASGPCDPCIDPLPQDRRFAAPAWQRWPYNLIYQSFLLHQQWWHNATCDLRGVSGHHEQIVNFGVRQVLDLVSPSNFLATNPEIMEQTLKTGGANLLQGARHWLEDSLRVAAHLPPAGTERFRPGHEVAITPGKVVLRNRLIELIQYAPSTPKVHARPLLIVPSWIMKYYILDLSPENSLAKYLVDQGHTVFMVSWHNPDAADRETGMDDYLKDGVLAALDAATEICNGQPVQAIGYCLGGTLLAIAAAWLAQHRDNRLASMTLLASQLDFTEPGELALFIDESQLAWLDDMMASQGYLDGKQMAGAFALLNQRDLVFSRMIREYLMGGRLPITDLSAWNADATRMPARQHSHYLHSLYRHNELAQGQYRVDGKPVALRDIHQPIFAVATQRDTVSPWRSVYKIYLLTDAEVSFCLSTGGHNAGIVSPPGTAYRRGYQICRRKATEHYIDPETWQEQAPYSEGSWWPAWARWLSQHGGALRQAPSLGSKARGYPPLGPAPGRYVLSA